WAEGLSTLSGIDGFVYAMTVFNDGSGDALYVGGSFSIAGDTMAANIAKWDGSSWSALGTGINGGSDIFGRAYSVNALTVFNDGGGDALYVGGYFTIAGYTVGANIAKWDGSTWSALGSGTSRYVYALTVFDDGGGLALYAGGDFTTAGGVSVNRIAKWDGLSWSALGSGIEGGGGTSPYVRALTVFDDGGGSALYVGGGFTTAGGVSANGIAKWDGSHWSAVGSGTNRYVYALTVFDDSSGPALYAGGAFLSAGEESFFAVAKWNGSIWSELGSGLDRSVNTLAVFDNGAGPALYAGGDNTFGTNRIVKWDGASWSTLGSELGGYDNPNVYALTVFDDGEGPVLYAGGQFKTAGGVAANRIAKWTGTNWTALARSVQGLGINGPAAALTVFDDGGGPALYAGGSFTSAGAVSANRIAKWDPGSPGSWSALGSGMTSKYSSVNALTVFDDGGGLALYAGGHYTAGLGSQGGIAKWDGASWLALGSGLSGYATEVYALTVFDDGGGPALYAAGTAINPGGPPPKSDYSYYVAKWGGSSWSRLGLSGDVYALTVFDDGGGPAIYAGGGYSVTKWNGSSWSILGSGINRYVRALAVFDDGDGTALYAGGDFTNAGGVSATHIAKWDGSGWSALGSGITVFGSTKVQVLAVFDDGGGPALYAGGHFQTAGGVSARNIAKWDGTSWSALGSGMNADVLALTVFDDGGGPALYAGGSFTIAGGNVSAYFARWSTHTETDIAGFAAGMTGPTAEPGCKTYDFDCDGDVDLHDYPRFLFHFERE
ncbi:MAG: hypothetical protein AABZ47_12190, partial [Planctomycetota bacterium]